MKTFPWFLVVVMMGLPLPAAMSEGEEPIMMTKDIELSFRTKQKARAFEAKIENGRFQREVDKALDAMIRLAVYKLKRDGHKQEARQLLEEWEDQFLPNLELIRGIGDHEPLSQWLSEKYLMLEFTLGKDIVYNLRLSDIHSVNHSVKVVLFCKDSVDEVEYFRHFVHDDGIGTNGPYRGLAPITIYWTTFFVCVGATWGTGFLFCSPIAMGTEWFTKNMIAPKISEPLWKKVCGVNQESY